jgi:polar amino acid transport system permease protein
MVWDWIPRYIPQLFHGLQITLLVLVFSVVVGFLLAIPIALAQVNQTAFWGRAAKWYCNYMRGTPLLMQLWLLYYGVGSLFPLIGHVPTWIIRLDALYYALLAFTINMAGYEAEILRGALLSVPKGELEAARAIGMSRFQVLRRIWLPSAVIKSLPTLTGDVIGQLKSTPLIFTIPVMDLMGVVHKVMEDTYRAYEPLLFIAAVYLVLTFILTQGFGWVERRIPQRRLQ